ncbi:MAG: aldo/keto reductase [Eubacteriales bacterium]
MERSTLGRSGIFVSRICFGSLTVGPLQAALSADAGSDVIAYALSRDINFIDTAQYYKNYETIRLALVKSQKYDTVISTKSYAYDRKAAKEAVEEARTAIDRDYIDIFMLHEQESVHTLRGHAEALDFLFEMKEQGVIRAVGASMHYIAAVNGACETYYTRPLDVIHPIFNKTGLGIADGSVDYMTLALRRAKALGIGIFTMKPLGGGHLYADAAAAFDFVLDSVTDDNRPLADSVAVGMQSIDEVDADLHYFKTRSFGSEAEQKLRTKQRHLHIEDYCQGCGLCAERCGQRAITIKNNRAVCDHRLCVLCGYCSAVCPQFAIKVL